MRSRIGVTFAFVALLAIPLAIAQRPGGGPEGPVSKSADVSEIVNRMLGFDANKDGALTRSEVTDDRLFHLFDRADADKNGTVTKAELTTLAEKEHSDDRGFGGPPGGGPPGFGPGGMPRPGEVLPAGLRGILGLSPEQKAQVDDLQKEVDARLEKILTSEQGAMLKEMRQRGPGRGGPPGVRRPGGPGGGPPPR